MINRYLRPHILKLVPYSTARDEYHGPAGIFLDANENPFESRLNRYPDPRQQALRKAVADNRNISHEMVFAGSGSDEVIDLLIRSFCEPGSDKVLVLPPTYGMYAVAATVHNVAVEEIVLNADFQPEVDKVLCSDARLLFLCSPNNPTGNLVERSRIETILDQFNGIVVVDEAYIDFAPGKSAIALLDTHPNLVVIQTFSKAFGLAAARVGLAFAHRSIIDVFDRIKLPYNLGNPSASAALKALGRTKQIENQIKAIIRNREILAQQLAMLDCVEKVFPSDANFLLVRFVDAARVFAHLLKQGIIVRDRSRQPLLEGCLRITVGTAAENRRLIETLKMIV